MLGRCAVTEGEWVRSDEGPALHDLDDEVLASGERLIAVSGAALCAAQVQVAIQP